MNIRKINNFFGYAFYVVGLLRIILLVIVIIQFATNMEILFSGGKIIETDYNGVSIALGFAIIALAIGSIIMIIINITKQPEVITGYLWGLGAILIEFITPSFIFMYVIFGVCGMYIKAGSKIININFGHYKGNKPTKKMIKNTDWFYGNVDK